MTTKVEDGGPAFPGVSSEFSRDGMSLRDWFEAVRDADEDCRKDGLPMMPPIPRAMIDRVLTGTINGTKELAERGDVAGSFTKGAEDGTGNH